MSDPYRTTYTDTVYVSQDPYRSSYYPDIYNQVCPEEGWRADNTLSYHMLPHN